MATREKLKPYSDEEVEAKIVEHGLDGWYLEDGWLRRKYNTDGWPSTLMLVNAVGYLCEAAYHHADLSVTWGKLWVKLKTHVSGGITDKDFALARSEEHTSELQSRQYLVCRLLLEKKTTTMLTTRLPASEVMI